MRLSEATLAEAPALPAIEYARGDLRPGIVHLGLGAFFRAHGLVYTHRALSHAPADEAAKWGVVGVSMRSATMAEMIGPQDGLYTVHERATGADPVVVLVGCLLRCVVHARAPSAVLDLLASADVRIVSLTVTEKGYCYDPASRALDLANVDVIHDLDPANARAPRSAVGLLVLALRARRAAGVPPFTCLSCDNLPHNGRTLRGLCVAFARALEPASDLARWIGELVPFPCTMVDCIVPAVQPADVDAAAAPDGPLRGVRDEAMVMCEPFRQWAVEDAFGPLGRPPWELAGAQLVADVAQHEALKLRVLNACHSTLAYVGTLCGFETIAHAMREPALAKLVAALVELDVLPALEPPAGVDVHEYARSTFSRFRNELLGHRTEQIAMDGSQKLPQRLLATARARLARADAEPCTASAEPALRVLPLAVGAWMAHSTRLDADGQHVPVRDPLASKFAAIATASTREPRTIAARMLALREVFGDDALAADDTRFARPVAQQLAALMEARTPERVLAHVRAFADALPDATLLAPGA
ncbi:hypothetical protein KFE25_005375 [Diacronema lutheri]|uniref:mannitol 2-dehydrogenase n=2 Tax=Diacronema lutheri TaxID=2081491 RepID=A0A8J5XUS7_DIALT|nr:hypothetical protein KFE25_005375 [Diacronema lutheri]